MADRNTLMLLEAIRLEIRAAAEDVASAVLNTPLGYDKAYALRTQADTLRRMAFTDANLANDEKEALGL